MTGDSIKALPAEGSVVPMRSRIGGVNAVSDFGMETTPQGREITFKISDQDGQRESADQQICKIGTIGTVWSQGPKDGTRRSPLGACCRLWTNGSAARDPRS